MKASVFPAAMALLGATAGAAPIVQNFESFNLGSPTQNGWLTGLSATVQESIVDTGISRFGDRSLYMEGTLISPTLGNRSQQSSSPYGVIAMDLLVGAGGAVIELVNLDTLTFNVRVYLEADGGITVADSDLAFESVAASWSVDTVLRLGFELLDGATDQYGLYLDGALIYSGDAFAQGGFDVVQFGLWNGDLNSSAARYSNLTVDNLSNAILIPLPTPLGLASAGLVGLVGLRRRR